MIQTRATDGRARPHQHGKLSGYKRHLEDKTNACEPCLRANRVAANRFRMKNPDKVKGYSKPNPERARKIHLRVKFGMTVEEYQKMHDKQNGLCYICSQPETSMQRGKVLLLSVDHCHTTGKIRSLLCKNCNVGLGAFGDNVDLMLKAIEYLKEHK